MNDQPNYYKKLIIRKHKKQGKPCFFTTSNLGLYHSGIIDLFCSAPQAHRRLAKKKDSLDGTPLCFVRSTRFYFLLPCGGLASLRLPKTLNHTNTQKKLENQVVINIYLLNLDYATPFRGVSCFASGLSPKALSKSYRSGRFVVLLRASPCPICRHSAGGQSKSNKYTGIYYTWFSSLAV